MHFSDLVAFLADHLIRVQLLPDGDVAFVGDVSKLTPDVKKSLIANKRKFVDLLSTEASTATATGYTIGGRVTLGKQSHAFDVWGLSERLLSPIAIDTETELIVDHVVPRLALVSVSDGSKHRLIHPDDLSAFIASHADCHFVCHNAAFDFAVVRQAIEDPANWVKVCDDGRLHDTMFLDALIRLGRGAEEPVNRDLGTLARNYLGVVIDKDDPYRLRYAELIGKPWEDAEEGFFSYAIKDAIVTHKLWLTLTAIADKLIEPFTEDIQAGYRDAWGLLTESLQVRAAIALDQIHRNGLSIDRSQVEATKQKLSTEVDRLVDLIGKLPEAEGVFKQKNGKFQLTASGKPSTNRSRLIEILEAVAFDLDLTPPRTAKTDTVRTSIKYWNQHADHCPFLRLWGQLEEVGKLCQFFAGLGTAEKIHPRYTVTVRTGRTSCRSPNVQQLPRSGGFREMVVPSPEHYFIAIDYSAIELRTLAAVCQRRYGESQLAETIKQGIDPHAFTAAMFEGETLEAFDNNPDKKTLRQRAKALNFGIPGGLGAKSLVAYASATYGVKMSVDEASAFRDKLIGEVYPELTEYLGDDAIDTLAINLKTSPMRVETAFDSAGVLGAAKRIVAGKGKANGDDYSEGFVNRIWETLKALNKNRKLRPSINARDAGDRLSRDLFFGPVVTLTGRLRGSVGFSQSRNTPFQGLAADGAKLALWRLYREGYRSVAFIHDEVLIEIPKDADFTAEAESIDRILCESMETLTGDIPIECEFSLANRWFKQAEAVFENGRLTPWEPNC